MTSTQSPLKMAYLSGKISVFQEASDFFIDGKSFEDFIFTISQDLTDEANELEDV